MRVSKSADAPRADYGRSNSYIRASDTALWVVALSLLAYPLFGTLVAFTSLPSLAASAPIRAVILLLCIALIVKTNSVVWTSPKALLFFAFWTLYFARLLWDMFVVDIPVAGEFMLNFVAFSVPTALAMLHAPVIDERRLCKLLLLLGSITCLLAIIASSTDLAGERSFTGDAFDGRLFLETVNPITFGHVGVTTIITALCMARYCSQLSDWLGVAVAVGLGTVTMQLAGSRGPVVALAICLIALALYRKKFRWILIPLFLGAFVLLSGETTEATGALATRVAYTAERDTKEERVLIVATALDQFLESPFLGSAIVERLFDSYPHNPILESAMALGVLGLALFLIIHYNAMKRASVMLHRDQVALPLLALQALVGAQVSGSIAASAAVWMFLALYAGAGVRSTGQVAVQPHQQPV